jgi:transcriptional regulator with PAS, ATPase and Fis domain
LENIIEHAMILTKGIEIQPRNLPSYLKRMDKESTARTDHPQGEDLAVLHNIERDLIARALERHSGRTAAVAKELGIHRSTLWRKMKRYGLSSS